MRVHLEACIGELLFGLKVMKEGVMRKWSGGCGMHGVDRYCAGKAMGHCLRGLFYETPGYGANLLCRLYCFVPVTYSLALMFATYETKTKFKVMFALFCMYDYVWNGPLCVAHVLIYKLSFE